MKKRWLCRILAIYEVGRLICSIPYMGVEYTCGGSTGLDCLVTIVDALRMRNVSIGQRLDKDVICMALYFCLDKISY